MSASLIFQRWSRATLAANAAVTALVPAANIFDSNARPEVSPRIVLGDDQEIPVGDLDQVESRYTRLFATYHIWKKEQGLAGVKAIAAAARAALRDTRWTADGYRCVDVRFEMFRAVRDPDGETAHGILTMQATLEELSP
jgi:hypothetical protein